MKVSKIINSLHLYIYSGLQKNWWFGQFTQELLNFHLDSRATWKISKRRFFGDFLNSFNWVTQIGPKTTHKIFFENISKNTGATVVQNFGILDGAAHLQIEIWPKFFVNLAQSFDEHLLKNSMRYLKRFLNNHQFTEKFRMPFA